MEVDPPEFDLVIVDEAHHIRNTATYGYRAVSRFCDAAEAVVLLTATPVQLQYDDLFVFIESFTSRFDYRQKDISGYGRAKSVYQYGFNVCQRI